MTSLSPTLVGPFADAALQWLLMRPRGDDLEAEQKGRKHLYAVDSNIVAFIGSPAKHAQSRHPSNGGRFRLGLGHVFSSDPQELCTSIAGGLASFLASGKLASPDAPILIIPPIHLEIEASFLALSAMTANDRREDAEVQDTIKTCLRELRKEGLQADELQRLAPQLQELIFESIGSPAELRRMAKLFASNIFQTLSQARLSKEIANVLRPTGFLSRVFYAEKRDGDRAFGAGNLSANPGWIRRLQENGHWPEQRLLEHDAEVMSRLEVWNESFALMERESIDINRRLLYITSDHRLFDAADAYFPKWLGDDISFSRAFLRHPRAYLAEDGVLDTSSADEFVTSRKLMEWFKFWVAPDGKNTLEFKTIREQWFVKRETPEGLINIISRLEGNAEEPSQEIIKQWRKFTRQTIAINPLTPFDIPALQKRERSAVKLLEEYSIKFHEEITDRRRESLSSYMESVAQLRFEVDFRSPVITRRSRNVVPIFFEDWTHAANFVTEVSRWGDEFDKRKYVFGLKEIEKDDQTGYAFYLAHAALFAGRGKWRNGALMARRATEISKSLPDNNRRGANGRESAYFEAVCLRHCARRIEDMAVCDSLIEAAREAYRLEGIRDPSLDVAEERFESEELALRLTRILFCRFKPSQSKDEPDNDDESIVSLSEQMQSLYDNVNYRFQQTKRVREVEHRSVHETLKELRTRLLLNLIGLGLLNIPASIVHQFAKNALTKLDEQDFRLPARGASPKESVFGLLTVNYARLRSARDKNAERNLLSSIDEFKDLNKESGFNVFPYDHDRFAEMAAVARTPWPTV